MGVSLPLLAELKRRRVFRALVGYGLVAFAVLQISEPVMHGLHWPESVLSYVVVALALGFPIVVGLAWLSTTSLTTLTPGAAESRSAKRRAWSQQRSTRAAMPARPSDRSAA